MITNKNGIVVFSTGRQLKNLRWISINSSLEVSNGWINEMLAYDRDHDRDKQIEPVLNPYCLTVEEIAELSDYMMGLWLQLKENVRKFGVKSPEIFIINK